MYRILEGDVVEQLKTLADASVDAIVTDPPYELGFMGKAWDQSGIAYNVDMWQEALRVLKPGGHLLAFGGSRTYHRLACAIEDAGFEIRDQIMWIYGSGFPKSLDVSKAIEKQGSGVRGQGSAKARTTDNCSLRTDHWLGWGTALKPAHEPIVVARKPLIGTVAANVLEHGTGALNIDGCRVETEENLNGGAYAKNGQERYDGNENWRYKREGGAGEFRQPQGRWPANVLHDGSEEVVSLFPETETGNKELHHQRKTSKTATVYGERDAPPEQFSGDSGSAARFFYEVKADSESASQQVSEESGADTLVSAANADLLTCSRKGEPSAARFFYKVRGDGNATNFAMQQGVKHFDSGSPARFFYCPKADKQEREIGCYMLAAEPLAYGNQAKAEVKRGNLEHAGKSGMNTVHLRGNTHPTVKPIDLMAWLCRLVTPLGGTVLDCFMGSGSTGIAALREGFNFIGIEINAAYCEIARRRMEGDAPLFNQAVNE
jgi:site-specific DNA-methyltransferase (adenine-specific)